jgi:hypothetical protein
MATTPTPISFSGRDYLAEVERLRQRAIQLLTEWTDHNYSDPGEVLLALQGTTTDLINAVVDNYAQENFLDARFRQSLIDQGKKIGYLPTLASCATTRLQFTRKDGVTGAITIPQWAAFSRSDGLEYPTVSSAQIPDGEDTVEVNAIQGTRVSYTLNAADFAINDWTKRPKYSLGANVAAGTVTMTHGDGAFVWSNIDTWWRVAATDLAFLLELNGDDDTVWLTVGNGVRGQGPAATPMTVTFIRTAAASGNCGTGVITIAPEALAASITCSNVEMAVGGAASETRESIRESLPDKTSIQRRAVSTKEHDYKALVEPLPGVLHCNELDINDSTEWPHMTVGLYVVPDGGGPMSSALKDLIWEELGKKGSLGEWKGRYLLYDATEKSVVFSLRVGLVQGYDSSTVQAAIGTALETYMDPTNQAIGGTVSFASIHALVMAVPGVSWVEFISPVVDVTCLSSEFPTYGGLTVVFA